MSVRWTLRTRTGPSRSETGGLTRRPADVKTDEEFLSVFAFLKSVCRSLKFLLSHFDFARSLRSAQSSGRWAGYDVGFDGQKGRAGEV